MQYVSIDGILSDLLKVNFGVPPRVPQGSVLGPLLFLLYINDLHNSVRFPSPFHFANDTSSKNYDADLKIKLCRSSQFTYILFILFTSKVSYPLGLALQGKL